MHSIIDNTFTETIDNTYIVNHIYSSTNNILTILNYSHLHDCHHHSHPNDTSQY